MGNVTTLLFDLGGVLIELGPVSEFMASPSMSPTEIWQHWSHSPSVRQYDAGQCSDLSFARNMIDEFDLRVSPDAFLAAFSAWPKGSVPGALELLERLGEEYHLACLSNTNNAHFEALLGSEPIMRQFDSLFLSYQTGLLKPDAEAFRDVLQKLQLAPSEVLFFDDNALNVDTARALGMNAVRADSLNTVINALNDRGITP